MRIIPISVTRGILFNNSKLRNNQQPYFNVSFEANNAGNKASNVLKRGAKGLKERKPPETPEPSSSLSLDDDKPKDLLEQIAWLWDHGYI